MFFQVIVDREVDKHTVAPLKLQQFGVQESKKLPRRACLIPIILISAIFPKKTMQLPNVV